MKENNVFAKCAWRLIPLLVLIYLVNFVDRVNVGFAALTMNKDLGFTPTLYGIGAGIFFIGYFVFQVPANAMLERLGARLWLFSTMAVWGAISVGTAFVQGAESFYVMRFLLGIAEAGFIPGMMLYLTFWFPQSYRARFAASITAGLPLGFVIGGPISSLILQMDGLAGFHGWQWLFLIEGVPACILAFVILVVLPDGPASAAWLTQSEKTRISSRLVAEDLAPPRGYWAAIRDRRVLALGVAYAINQSSGYGSRLWLPQIVQDMGFSTLSVGFVVAALNILAIPAMILWGRSSDARRERAWHAALTPLLTATGFAMASLAHSDLLALAGFALLTISILLVHGPFWGLASSFLGGRAAASGFAVISSIGSLGGLFGPVVVGTFKQATGNYGSSMMVLALASLLEAVILLALGLAIARQNLTLQPQATRA